MPESFDIQIQNLWSIFTPEQIVLTELKMD